MASVSTFFFIFGTLSPLTIQGLSFFFNILGNNILLRLPLWILTIGFTLAGLAFHITARRILAGEIDSLKHRMIKKSKLERNVRTDVREVRDMLPDSIAYNPLDYIALNKGIFIGLDKDDQPQYITPENVKLSTPTLSTAQVPVKASVPVCCFIRQYFQVKAYLSKILKTMLL